MFTMLLAAFPDMQLTVGDQVANGDKVVPRAAMRGDVVGFPASGKQMPMTGTDILRIVGGKLVERWGNFDGLRMMQQLGAIPAPGQAGQPASKSSHSRFTFSGYGPMPSKGWKATPEGMGRGTRPGTRHRRWQAQWGPESWKTGAGILLDEEGSFIMGRSRLGRGG